jgi:hypothetical protein
MHRARQRFLSLFALSAAFFGALFTPAMARAFHSGSVFDKPPGAGGGGGIFYTGAPLERGWTCALCHLDAPGKIKLRMQVEPSELFQTFRYVPGQTYTFTATLDGESRGLSSPLSNYNTMAVSITDAKGLSTGSIGGFAAEDFYSGGPTTITSAGQKVGVTSWTFSYTAPDAAAGPLSMYLAAVDGNGADSPPTKTLTDPFGDDVFVAKITLQPGGLAEAPVPSADPRGMPLFAVALGLLGAARRRRKDRAHP